ncbi:hypothetical protein GY15_10360 [Delftia sp. 670]|nr:hypothetical protein GY15_10360 [Delftia sp. 670]
MQLTARYLLFHQYPWHQAHAHACQHGLYQVRGQLEARPYPHLPVIEPIVREPLAPGLPVAGHREQHLLARPVRRGCCLPGLLQRLRAGHRHQKLVVQAMRGQPGPVSRAHGDGGVYLAAVEVDVAYAGMDVHGHPGLRLVEAMQVRQQPFGAEGGQGGQVERATAGLA